MEDILENIKLEDFTEGFSKEEKFNLAKDMTVIHNVLQNHDQSIFQIIAGYNALQKIMMDKLEISEEEMESTIKTEYEGIQAKFQEQIAKMQDTEE